MKKNKIGKEFVVFLGISMVIALAVGIFSTQMLTEIFCKPFFVGFANIAYTFSRGLLTGFGAVITIIFTGVSICLPFINQ